MNLPTQPGLQRRLAYGELLRRRNIPRPTTTLTMSAFNLVFDEISENGVMSGLKVAELYKNSKVIVLKNVLCSICYDGHDGHDDGHTQTYIYRELCCNHSFHINCIDEWLAKNTTCPMCRRDLRSNDLMNGS
jgi:hypothetical protein